MKRMVMKMAAASTISLLLLCCLALPSAGSDKCDHYAATGNNFTVPLKHKLEHKQRLIWKHNNDKVIDRRPNNVFTSGKREDLEENGSLKLTKLTKSNAGTYTPEVYDDNGKLIPSLKLINLCVLDPVPTPTVTFVCSKPNVVFTCMGQTKVDGASYEWLQNNNKVSVKKTNTPNKLTLVAQEVEKDSFSCNISNSVSFKISKPVTQTCFKTKPLFPENLFGINTWIFVGAGGGIVLVLIIVVIVCCIRTKRRKRMQLKEEGELRLAWTSEQQHHQRSHPPDQHHRQHHHHHHHQQQPAGHTGPRQHRPKQHRDQQRPRAPDHQGGLPPPGGHPPQGGQPQPSPRRPAQAPRPVDKTDDEVPPPLPQPRKKAPKTPRV